MFELVRIDDDKAILTASSLESSGKANINEHMAIDLGGPSVVRLAQISFIRRAAQVPNSKASLPLTDLFIIGGGINGCGIARDAAGRGSVVALAEMDDLASATSSASTKLFHGGLRYLEYFEFRLVREALIEREMLLRAMPHISWPMRFVLPYHREMRFEAETPTSRLLGLFMPWMNGRRPRLADPAGAVPL